MIDTHAHIHTSAFDADRRQVLDRAYAAGLTAILEVNIDRSGWDRVREVVASEPRLFATVGIHPHDTGSAELADLEILLRDLGHPKVRAVGETGLDYYRDYAPHDRQRQFFRRHVAAARESGLPLVVHSRERRDGPSAHDDTLRIIEEEGRGEVRGVLHCYSGDLPMARRARSLGFKLGLGGAITYSPARSGPLLRSIADELGLGIFILETDCPFLAPHPRRNDRNEPGNVPRIAAVLADYLGRGIDEIEAATDHAARELFDLDSGGGGGGRSGLS